MTNDDDEAARLAEAAGLLDLVADGALTAADAIARWPLEPDDTRPGVGDAFHALHHFAADDDIRAKDPEYAAATAAELRHLARRMMGERPSPWLRLWRAIGPRTDVRYMTRAELFRSARQFLVGGVVFVGLWFLAAFTMEALFDSPRWAPAAMFVAFALSIAIGMCLVASAYLAVRGLLRSPTYDPDAVWRRDMRSWNPPDAPPEEPPK